MDLGEPRARLPGAVALASLPLPHRRNDRPRSRAQRGARRAVRRRGGRRGHARARAFRYDTLVIAVGSLTNDFGTPGVQEHAIALETPAQAARFHRRLVNACIRAHAQAEPLRPGATARRDHRRRRDRRRARGGAAPHHAAAGRVRPRPHRSGEGHQDHPDRGGRPDPAGAAGAAVGSGDRAARQARRAGADRVARRGGRCRTACGSPIGEVIPAELVVWAAGVKAPDFLQGPRRAGNQPHQPARRAPDAADDARRQTSLRSAIARPARGRAGEPGRTVPPRAQAAHQQASHMVKQIRRAARGTAAEAVSLPRLRLAGLARRVFSTVGNLMGGLVGGSLLIEGYFARDDVPVAVQDARARAARILARSRSTRWRG